MEQNKKPASMKISFRSDSYSKFAELIAYLKGLGWEQSGNVKVFEGGTRHEIKLIKN